MRKYCGRVKNEISPNCVFCREMARNNQKNGFWADVRPSVRSSEGLFVCLFVVRSFFACVSETEKDSATKIGNRIPQEKGKVLFHHQGHPAKFTGLAGPNKAKFRVFGDFLENGSNNFFSFFVWRYLTL